MAASPTRRNAEFVVVGRCIAVAYSGGRDSTALLHAVLAQATSRGVPVVAMHVQHGLSPNADAWLEHCKVQCLRWARRHPDLKFVAQRLTTRPAPGESVEQWARRARYRALREMAQAHGATLVLLAHHRHDQAETLLLQALRGAGVAGLSGMPQSAVRDGIAWQRPWLSQSGDAIAAYVRRHRLSFIVDESNQDARFARNLLRRDVWPALVGAFPQADVSLAASAQWAQEAAAALSELAQIDLEQVAVAGVRDGFALGPWLNLSPARRSNALRTWLKVQCGAPAAASLVSRLMNELPATRSARWPVASGELRLHRGVMRFATTPRDVTAGVPRESTLSVLRGGCYRLPGWAGRLQVSRVRDNGVPLAWLARIDLRPREGAEKFQAGIGRPPRSLKKQFQSAGVPAWARVGPLIYSGGQLVFVPGLGLDARVIGVAGQALVSLSWLPAEAGS